MVGSANDQWVLSIGLKTSAKLQNKKGNLIGIAICKNYAIDSLRLFVFFNDFIIGMVYFLANLPVIIVLPNTDLSIGFIVAF